ncbi:hypothetical protein EAN93_27110 [Klebsiella pneumoniae]|nr:hypothetical protein EAN93_27110 [Klebsiella pneumoniae]
MAAGQKLPPSCRAQWLQKKPVAASNRFFGVGLALTSWSADAHKLVGALRASHLARLTAGVNL